MHRTGMRCSGLCFNTYNLLPSARAERGFPALQVSTINNGDRLLESFPYLGYTLDNLSICWIIRHNSGLWKRGSAGYERIYRLSPQNSEFLPHLHQVISIHKRPSLLALTPVSPCPLPRIYTPCKNQGYCWSSAMNNSGGKKPVPKGRLIFDNREPIKTMRRETVAAAAGSW